MFGYVRPVREELKCKDFDLYRATYCGLCRELRRKYGLLAPMFLNFDFTFLALLLWPAEQRFVPCRGRCHANPLARKEMCPADPALEAAADFNAWFNGLQNVLDDNAATNLLNITNALDARVDMLEAVLFNDITTNPFLILFDDLDGVTSTGIWNESLQRIEC